MSSAGTAFGGFVMPFLVGYAVSRYLFGHELLLAMVPRGEVGLAADATDSPATRAEP